MVSTHFGILANKKFQTWPVENGSVMGPLLTVSEYAIQIIKKMQYENVKSWAPKQDVTDAFNDHVQVRPYDLDHPTTREIK